jgi:signal transduction histidine kinase
LVRLLDDALQQADRPARLHQSQPVELTALLGAAIRKHGRSDLAGAPTAISTFGDGRALANLFDNLIANALSSGSRAVLRLDRGTSAVVVHVDDDGPGVPRGDRAGVFHRRTGREACVTARQIARAHGGDIVISCSPEGGARFTVRLPLHSEQATELQVAS